MGPRRTSFCGAMLALVACGAKLLPAQLATRLDFPQSLADSAPDWTVRLEKPTGCLASIPPPSMHRVPVFLRASIAEHDDTTLSLQTDLMAQDVADEFRRLLGAAGNEVPTADTNFVWYSVPTELVVIAHQNGEMSARAKRSGGDFAATSLLAQAFDAARARGTARLIWPDGFKADSILVRLLLWPAYAGEKPKEVALGENGMKFATFYLTEPELTPAYPLPDQEPPRYPGDNMWNRFEGYVLMQFVVDSTGRADPNTIRDIWPAGKPRLSGESRTAYDDFLQSVRDWETRLLFKPARLGPCAIKQQVQQPLVFKIQPRR
jgi:hypothetical protein